MKLNPGHLPTGTRDKRVRVELANGMAGKGDWAANTTRWSLTGHPFDVRAFEVVG